MKRVFALLLALMLLLSACGKKNLSWQEQYDLGVKYLSEGNYKQALECFEFVISVEPKYADAYKGHARASIGMAKLLHDENPDNPMIRTYLENAMQDYEMVSQLDQSFAAPDYTTVVERLMEEYFGPQVPTAPGTDAQDAANDSEEAGESAQDNSQEAGQETAQEAMQQAEQAQVNPLAPWESEPIEPLSTDMLLGTWNMIPDDTFGPNEFCMLRFHEDGSMSMDYGKWYSDQAIMAMGNYTVDALGDGSAIVSASLTNYYEIEFGDNYPGPGNGTVSAMFIFTLRGGVLHMEMLSSETVLIYDYAGYQADFVPGVDLSTNYGQPVGITAEQAIAVAQRHVGIADGAKAQSEDQHYSYACEEYMQNENDGQYYWVVLFGIRYDDGRPADYWSQYYVNMQYCFVNVDLS